jgi:hypothetical protein
MTPNIIRAGIFLAASLALLLFPHKVLAVHTWILKKLNIKCRCKKDQANYKFLGIGFLAIAVILLLYGTITS